MSLLRWTHQYVPLLWEAAQAAWDKARFSHGAP